ncbi:MAG: CopG family transcriptional regulator [Actinomycetota bacterium]
MTRIQTMVQLSDRLVRLLDQQAERRGISRSALIRTAVEEFLRHDQEAALSQEIVDGYTRIPPAVPDEWGRLAQIGDRATVDVLHRLDAEERAQGHEAW